MRPITQWNEKLMLTLACGSPGSAWAYHRLLDHEGPDMVRRTSEAAEEQPAAAAEARVSLASALGNLIGKFWRRLEQWSWEQQVRRDEAYLAQAQNLFDLEARMRRLDGGAFARARALH
jgi:hypothetical protein